MKLRLEHQPCAIQSSQLLFDSNWHSAAQLFSLAVRVMLLAIGTPAIVDFNFNFRRAGKRINKFTARSIARNVAARSCQPAQNCGHSARPTFAVFPAPVTLLRARRTIVAVETCSRQNTPHTRRGVSSERPVTPLPAPLHGSRLKCSPGSTRPVLTVTFLL